MAILNSVLSWFVRQRIHQIDLFLKYPHDVQRDWLTKLLKTAAETEYGKKYLFSSINRFETFQEALPITDYNSLKPYIDRLRHGEQKLLWPSEIKWFAKSSGTTSDKSKFIPVSSEALEECHYKAGKDMYSIYLNLHNDSLLFDGFALGMGGSHQVNELNNDSFCGDVSAILISNLPFWAETLRTPTLQIALMDKWEEKLEKMALATLEKNVTNIAGVPSWTLLLLRRILEITGKENISEVWPNLEVFFHGGVSFTPYRSQFQKLIPSPRMCYMETYNATEGFFGIQDTVNGDDMLLMLDYGIFYEFVPLEKAHEEHPKTLSLEEVELGKNYAIIITTNAGLWRYRIGDTVIFTCLSPYRIKISGRTKTFINAFGEEVIEENALKAVAIACEKTGAEIHDFTAAPIYLGEGRQARHQWLIEFSSEPSDLAYFSEILDNALKAINSDYEAKRYHNLLLHQVEVIPMPPGTFYRWLKSRNKLGGQHKVPHLSNDRVIVEEILHL